VRKDLQDSLVSPVWGWFGQKSPFAFDIQYTPAEGIRRFLAGSPPIIGLQSLESALDLPLDAGMDAIRAKSVALTTFAIELFDQMLEPLGFTLGTPREPEWRGSHISIRHPDAYRINRALIEEMKVIPDFREPDNIRLGFAPLYTTLDEVWRGMDRIRQVVQEERYTSLSAIKPAVT